MSTHVNQCGMKFFEIKNLLALNRKTFDFENFKLTLINQQCLRL